jgi:hypothetical protein
MFSRFIDLSHFWVSRNWLFRRRRRREAADSRSKRPVLARQSNSSAARRWCRILRGRVLTPDTPVEFRPIPVFSRSPFGCREPGTPPSGWHKWASMFTSATTLGPMRSRPAICRRSKHQEFMRLWAKILWVLPTSTVPSSLDGGCRPMNLTTVNLTAGAATVLRSTQAQSWPNTSQ